MSVLIKFVLKAMGFMRYFDTTPKFLETRMKKQKKEKKKGCDE